MSDTYHILINIYNHLLNPKTNKSIGSWKYSLYRNGKKIKENSSIEFNFIKIRLCLTAYWKALKQIDKAEDIFVFTGCDDLRIHYEEPEKIIAPHIALEVIGCELKRTKGNVLVLTKTEMDSCFRSDNQDSYTECKQTVLNWEEKHKKEFEKIKDESKPYIIYTDGSCHPVFNKGIITYAYHIIHGGECYEGSFVSKYGDIGEAELRAVVEALRTVPDGRAAEVYSDSLYVVSASNNPETRKSNLDFWKEFDDEKKRLAYLSVTKVDKLNDTNRNRIGNQIAHDLCQEEYFDFCYANYLYSPEDVKEFVNRMSVTSSAFTTS